MLKPLVGLGLSIVALAASTRTAPAPSRSAAAVPDIGSSMDLFGRAIAAGKR